MSFPTSANNDIGTLMKSNLITMTALNNNNDNKDDNSNPMYHAIYGIIMLTLIDNLMKYLPLVINKCNEITKHYIEQKTKKLLEDKINIKTEVKSAILLGRSFKEQKSGDELVDAVIDYLSNLNSTKWLIYNNSFMVNNRKEFIVEKDILAKVIELQFETDGSIESIKIRIYSYKKELTDLREWLNDILHKYRIEQVNKLGNKRFFFDEIIMAMPDVDLDERFMDLIPKRIPFSMTEFKTNKSLINTFGKHNSGSLDNAFNTPISNFSGANKEKKKFKSDDLLNLSFLLNLLDGVLETPGRILIMTSNYPEKLDKALIRPGRIDINLEVGCCDNHMIKDMFLNFYDTLSYEKTFDFTIENSITPAKLIQILCNNYNDKNIAYNKIMEFISN
jgi:hypothetical protein